MGLSEDEESIPMKAPNTRAGPEFAFSPNFDDPILGTYALEKLIELRSLFHQPIDPPHHVPGLKLINPLIFSATSVTINEEKPHATPDEFLKLSTEEKVLFTLENSLIVISEDLKDIHFPFPCKVFVSEYAQPGRGVILMPPTELFEPPEIVGFIKKEDGTVNLYFSR